MTKQERAYFEQLVQEINSKITSAYNHEWVKGMSDEMRAGFILGLTHAVEPIAVYMGKEVVTVDLNHMKSESKEKQPQLVLVLTHMGRDSWDRPVYECDGRLYVDVDPRKDRAPDICTKQGNQFDGEPLSPVPQNVKLRFSPARDTW